MPYRKDESNETHTKSLSPPISLHKKIFAKVKANPLTDYLRKEEFWFMAVFSFFMGVLAGCIGLLSLALQFLWLFYKNIL